VHDAEQTPRSQTSADWHATLQSPQFWALVSGFTQALLQTISPVPHVGIGPPSVVPPVPLEPPLERPPVFAPPAPAAPPVLPASVVVPAEPSGMTLPVVKAVSSLPQCATKMEEPITDKKARMDRCWDMPLRGRQTSLLLITFVRKKYEPPRALRNTANGLF
jgi:hypothetical protein